VGQISLVIGQAGTGKTTWLMEKAKECAPALLTAEHRRVLVITRMHGARRRLEMKLREFCPGIRCSVATIDGFALSFLNRWRTALGYVRPVQAVEGDIDFAETIFGTEAGFAKVLMAATDLLHSPMVRRIVGETYPLIIIDEFQDCYGPLLEFIKELSKCSLLVLAADDFQMLDTSFPGCPAVDWVRAVHENAPVEIEELTVCHRTSVQSILEAAKCLRNNTKRVGQSVHAIVCPNAVSAAWQIIPDMVLNPRRQCRHDIWALISPSHDNMLEAVLTACDDQLKKKGHGAIRWNRETIQAKEVERLIGEMGLPHNLCDSDCAWELPLITLSPHGRIIAEHALRFARLRGIKTTYKIITHLAKKHISYRRAYSHSGAKRIVTTVHGAKNREFDHVVLLWNPFSTNRWSEDAQRRLLYNGITRAKKTCRVLWVGREEDALRHPVFSLLGQPTKAFSSRSSTRQKSARMKRVKQ
jgi:superfamily I DNA and RNA helicase